MLSEAEHHSPRPTAQAVMGRAIILHNIFVKALATPPDEVLARFREPSMADEKSKLAAGCEAMFSKHEKVLRAAGLWEQLEENEREFFQTGAFETIERQRIDASWLAESIMCLLWAVGRVPQIPAYDQQVDPISNKFFQAGERAHDMIDLAVLRQQPEIDKQRDWAELWHWRCRTHKLLEEKKIPATLPNGTTMVKLIQIAAGKAAEEGVFAEPIKNDFPAFGKPFQEISADELFQIRSIVQERHRSLNWLCGYAPDNRWSQTPTDT
jgi:hypothetical protein